MKKKIVILVLAAAMITTKFMGAAEVLAAGTESNEAPGVVENANSQSEGSDDPNSESTAQVYGILMPDNKVYKRENAEAGEPSEPKEEILGSELDKITDILIDEKVPMVTDQKFRNKSNIEKLTFENAQTNTVTTTISVSAFEGTNIKEVVLPKGLQNIWNDGFRNVTTLEKVVFGSGLRNLGAGAFRGTTSLKSLDLRGAENLANINSRVFQGSALEGLYIGQKTKVPAIGKEAFNSEATKRTVHLVGDDGAYLGGGKRKELETKWRKLTAPENGSWQFFDAKAPTPNAVVNYDQMILSNLKPSTTYSITADDSCGSDSVWQSYTSNRYGQIGIRTQWSGKILKIKIPATPQQAESEQQSFVIQPIYTVTVPSDSGTVGYNTVGGGKVRVVAPETNKDGDVFVRWEASNGVHIGDLTQRDLTFEMPPKNFTLTKVYQPSEAAQLSR